MGGEWSMPVLLDGRVPALNLRVRAQTEHGMSVRQDNRLMHKMREK